MGSRRFRRNEAAEANAMNAKETYALNETTEIGAIV